MCSRFLGSLSEETRRVYTCPEPGCRKRTCGQCRQQHSGGRSHTCRTDADAMLILWLSRVSGWARCPGCLQMIELRMGCNHMKCRCGANFCYLCRARWKTCSCPVQGTMPATLVRRTYYACMLVIATVFFVPSFILATGTHGVVSLLSLFLSFIFRLR